MTPGSNDFAALMAELNKIPDDGHVTLQRMRGVVPDWLEPGRIMPKEDFLRLEKLGTWRQICDAQKRMTLLDAKRWICIELYRQEPRPKFIKRLWQSLETIRKQEEIAELAKLFPKLKARTWVGGGSVRKTSLIAVVDTGCSVVNHKALVPGMPGAISPEGAQLANPLGTSTPEPGAISETPSGRPFSC